MPLFFAYIENKADRQDDEVLKIKAKNEEAASRYAKWWVSCTGDNFTRLMTGPEFKKFDPYWHTLLWGTEPYNANDIDEEEE